MREFESDEAKFNPWQLSAWLAAYGELALGVVLLVLTGIGLATFG